MNNLLNNAILPLLNDGSLSMSRINSLIYIKDFIDRISTKKYLNEETISELTDRYGVSPNVITWGDYFQTEMATSLLVLSDEEFDKAIDTVRFDMIASYIIFSEKDESFFTWVETTYSDILKLDKRDHEEEELEILHLKILMDYYVNLGIEDRFLEDEMEWYSQFKEAEVV